MRESCADSIGAEGHVAKAFDYSQLLGEVRRLGADRSLAAHSVACETTHATVGPDALFDHLLRRRELISYRAAYEIAFGPLLGPWRGYVSARRVIAWTSATRWRTVAELQIGLDALIVVDSTERPAGRPRRSGYGRTQNGWAERFGGWTLCKHKARKTVPSDENVLSSR